MQPSKDIDIVINDYNRITIGQASRAVKADDIYNLLGYERGDIYTVESVNEQNIDVPVLQFFVELFKDITDRLNRLSETQNDDLDENAEGEEETTGRGTYSFDQMDDEELPFPEKLAITLYLGPCSETK